MHRAVHWGLVPATAGFVARLVGGPLCSHKISKSFARFVSKNFIGDLQVNHAINAKAAKVIARFAPRGERPVFTPEVKR